MNFTKEHAFDLAQRYSGIEEVGGSLDNPMILAMLKLDNKWPEHDEVPWCSAFMNFICWLARLPRSKDLRARSWLTIGKGVPLDKAEPGDIIVLKRGKGEQPGPEVIAAPGHVGFYAGMFYGFIEVLGGNQGDTVKVSRYPVDRLLGVRRLV
ncbi:MAG: TIGR02594 family protein [Gammaproteobacteria bacterium]